MLKYAAFTGSDGTDTMHQSSVARIRGENVKLLLLLLLLLIVVVIAVVIVILQ